jgi:hypothetical protein
LRGVVVVVDDVDVDDVIVLVVVGIIFNGLGVMFVHSGLKDLDLRDQLW